eukprot:SM000243S08591  [mRNA]  locus=s243:33134:40685:- [translate_table: standard]
MALQRALPCPRTASRASGLLRPPDQQPVQAPCCAPRRSPLASGDASARPGAWLLAACSSSSSSTTTSSSQKPATAARKGRRSRRKSKEAFLQELTAFLLAEGLPVDIAPAPDVLASRGRLQLNLADVHTPDSLAECGGQDLANSVKRRGFQSVQDLLSAREGSPQASMQIKLAGRHPGSGGGSSKDKAELVPCRKDNVDPADPAATLAAQGDHIGRAVSEVGATGRDTLQQLNAPHLSGMKKREPSSAITVTPDNSLQSSLQATADSTLQSQEGLPKEVLCTDRKDLYLDIVEKQREIEVMTQKEQEIQLAFKSETQMELQRIRSALELRDKEVIEIAQELQEAQAQITLVRTKAAAELVQAKQALLDKESRLRTLEQAVSQLKQVRIEYWGSGSKVKLAGSFNGWQYHLDMHCDLDSEIHPPDGLRGPMLWDVELWLPPGVYEVKFIVDGEWQVDTRRPLTMDHNKQNNVLEVHHLVMSTRNGQENALLSTPPQRRYQLQMIAYRDIEQLNQDTSSQMRNQTHQIVLSADRLYDHGTPGWETEVMARSNTQDVFNVHETQLGRRPFNLTIERVRFTTTVNQALKI